MSKAQSVINYTDTLQNANTIKEYLSTPTNSRTSLEGLDATISAMSLTATSAATMASLHNSGKTGAAQAVGAMSTGAAFQLNAAVASASLAATAAYLKQGQFDKAASTSLGVVSGIAGMVQTGASTAPGVNAVEGTAAAVGSAATAANLAISNKELFEKVMDGLGEQYDQSVKDFSDWFLPKVFEFGENFDKAIDPDRWRDFIKEKFDEAGKAWDKFQKDFGDWFIPWAKDLGDWLDLNRDGKYHVYDPLVLDLDGNGIETIGTNGYAGALFDHNSDGIRTATGWVSSDDGLLVIDRNGDGVINNGAELFSDSFVLSDGTKAEHGYAALAEFDTNGDGKVDADDKDFDKLRVWRDLNQDGISQEGELFTLAEVGVQSLNAAYQDVNTRLGNGNTIAQKGSYTLSDGTTREMGDLLLAADHLHSRYTDSVPLTEEQMQAANVQGIGRLRDLREAAALSPKLAETLAAYSNAETKAEQKALVDQLVAEWAKTDPRYGGNIQFAAPFIKTAGEGRALTPSQEREMLNKLYVPSKEYLDMVDKTWHKIATLDAFSGEKSNIIYVSSDADVLKFFNVANKAHESLSRKTCRFHVN